MKAHTIWFLFEISGDLMYCKKIQLNKKGNHTNKTQNAELEPAVNSTI